MHTRKRLFSDRLPVRGLPQYLTSFLAVTAQRHALLKPCATFLLESRLVQGIWQLSVPATLTLAGTHSLSGATTEVVAAAGSPNPASGQTGVNFTWFFGTTGAHRAKSYTVSGLPGGLTYKYGSPLSSITGKPTDAGTSRITIRGWENSNKTGGVTPTYTLTLNVSAPPPVITALSPGGQFDRGASVNLSVTATGATLTYQWRRDGVAVPGATGSAYAIPSLSDATAGTYTVVVSSGTASITSNPIVVSLKSSPVEVWRSTFWAGANLSNPLISGLDADPDADGLENVLEYILGLNPTAANPDTPGAISPDPGDSQFVVYTVALNPDATDYSVRFQRSTDLASGQWTTIDEEDPEALVTRTASQLTLRLPRTGSPTFVRLVSVVR